MRRRSRKRLRSFETAEMCEGRMLCDFGQAIEGILSSLVGLDVRAWRD